MRQTKVFVAAILILIVQIACNQEYSGEPMSTVVVQIPSIMKRDQEYTLLMEAVPSSICFIGVGYYNSDSKWTFVELPEAIANNEGKCEWKWKVPENALAGVAEIRGYIELDGSEAGSLFPKKTCIEKCP